MARRAISAIGEKYGTPYLHGTGPEIICKSELIMADHSGFAYLYVLFLL